MKTIDLERDIADFYETLAKSKHLKEYRNILLEMQRGSEVHGDTISEFRVHFDVPPTNCQPLLELQEKIKRSLVTELSHDRDSQQVIESLASSEQILGKIYATVAKHYHLVSERYEQLAQLYERLAAEETEHYDAVLTNLPEDSRPAPLPRTETSDSASSPGNGGEMPMPKKSMPRKQEE